MNEAIAQLPWTDRQWDLVQQAVKAEAERTRIPAKSLRVAKADATDVAVPAYALGTAGQRFASNPTADAALRAAFGAAAVSGAAVNAATVAAGAAAGPAVPAAAGAAAAAAAAAGGALADVVAASTAAAVAAGAAPGPGAGNANAIGAAAGAAAVAGAAAAAAASAAAAGRSQRTDVDSDPTVYLTTISKLVHLRNREVADADLEAALTYFRRAGAQIAQAENALLLNGRGRGGAGNPNPIPGAPTGIIVNHLPPAAGPVQGLFAAAGVPGQAVRPMVRIVRPAQAAIIAAGGRAAANGGEVTAALARATAQLEADAYHAPFAMVASTRIWTDINQPSAQSLVPARAAIERMLQGGPLLQSALLPAGFALVFAHDSPELEQVVARDINVKFLQVSEEPRFVFRVSVRTALRVRDRNAIATMF